MKNLKSLIIGVLCAALALLFACGTSPGSDLIEVNGPSREPDVWTPAPTVPGEVSPTDALAPQADPTPIPDDGLPYYIYVEKGSFTLTIYEKDESGAYTNVYAAYRIAHGGNKTPAGKFTIPGESGHERWHDFPDGGTVQYAVRYEGRLYIHSPLYATDDPTQLWPKYYDGDHGIGLESTGGCLRMVTEAAKFIYENCPEGTVLEIVNGAPKGTESDPPPDRNGRRIDPTDYDTLRAKGYIKP